MRALLQGVAYTFGIEPGYLGNIGFYAPGWEYREGPVQLTGLLMNDSGIQELEDFRCYMTGNAHYQVDLVQSFEVGGTPCCPMNHTDRQHEQSR